VSETNHSKLKPKFKAGAELRERILDAASRLFAEAGYQNVSMRKIAEEAGCSQMAAYRHFADKDDLIRQLRIDSYNQFATVPRNLHGTDPIQRLKQSLREFVRLAASHPREYTLAFITPAADKQDQELRVKITKPISAYMLECVQLALPPGSSETDAEERVHQILACLHGMTLMLITHPRAYGLTVERAIRELESAFDRIVFSS
jgi:AcrR family transcriptional regulator